MRYLENRGLIPGRRRKVWASWVTARRDEPETLGAITLASREKLDNLIFVVNCNLQRLDGPVRGNGTDHSGTGSGVSAAPAGTSSKCCGARDWDELFARDQTGLLVKRMDECVDGEYQNFKARGAALRSQGIFRQVSGTARSWSTDMSDEEICESRSRRPRSGEGLSTPTSAAVEHRACPR